jgi:hypothetical protein
MINFMPKPFSCIKQLEYALETRLDGGLNVLEQRKMS